MAESKRIVWLIVVMMAAVTVSTAVAITVLYRTAFERERAHLIQNADDQAHLMEAVARFDQAHHGDHPGSSEADTLSQVESAFHRFPSEGQIAEITVAQRSGDHIVYLVTHGRVGTGDVEPIPLDSKLAEPMRRALSGHSGSMIGLDYRGVTVLAAYHPIPILDAGVVAKMDLADIRAPFLRGAAMVIGLASLLVTVASGAVRAPHQPDRQAPHRIRAALSAHLPRAPPCRSGSRISPGSTRPFENSGGSGVTDLGRHLADHPELQRAVDREGPTSRRRTPRHWRCLARAWAGSSTPGSRAHLCPPPSISTTEMLQALWAGQGALLNQTIAAETLDGRHLTVILSMMIPGANDEYHSVPVSALDVSADVNLRRREEELRPDPGIDGRRHLWHGPRRQCTFVNRAALRMLGYPDEGEVLGRDMHSLIHHSCRDGTPLAAENCPILRACGQTGQCTWKTRRFGARTAPASRQSTAPIRC